MAPSLGSASVDVSADTSTIEGAIGSAFKKAAAVAAAAFAGFSIGSFVSDAVRQASDLNESTNAIRVTLGDAADDFLEFGKNAATQLGITQAELNAALVPTSALLKNAGSEGEVLEKQMEQLALRATDVGSIFNADVNEVLDAFGAAMRGETEPIRKFGVSLDDAALASKAVALGLAASEKEASKAAKTQAALALIMEQTAQTEGDFANTSMEFANASKIVGAQFEELKAQLGAPLLAPISEVLTGLGPVMESLVPAMEVLGAAIAELITGLGPGLSALIDGLSEGLTALAPAIAPLGDAFGAIGVALAPLLPALGEIIGTLLPPLAEVITRVVEALTPLIADFASFAAQLVSDLMPALEPILELLGEVAEMLARELSGALSLILPMLADLLLKLTPLIPPMLDILSALLPLIPPIVQLAVTVANLLLPVLTQLAPVLSNVAKVVSKVLKTMIDSLVKSLNFVLGKVSDFLNTLIDGYNNTVARLPRVSKIEKVDYKVQLDTSSLALVDAAVESVKLKTVDMSKAITASAAQVAKAAGTAGKKASEEAAKSAKEQQKKIEAALTSGWAGIVDIADRTSKQTTESLKRAFAEVRADFATAGLKSLAKQLKTVQVEVVNLGKARDKLDKQIEAAADSLADLRDQRDELKKGLVDASRGVFNVAISGQFGSSVELIQRSMDNALSTVKEFRTLTKQLADRGLSADLLKQLYEVGPEAGLASARALSQASDAQLKQLNKDNAKLVAEADKLAKQASSKLFTAGIEAAKGLVKGLQSERSAIVKEMDAIADALVKSIKKKLKIKSPSQVMADEVGVPSGEGIAKGLEAAQGDVNVAVSRVAEGMSGAAGGLEGGLASGMTLVAEINATGPTLQDIIDVKIKQVQRAQKTNALAGSRTGTIVRG